MNVKTGGKWYTNDISTIKLFPGDPIPEGYHKGRTFNIRTWNKGLTAETDDRVKKNADSCHETRRQNGTYENPWNKGLSKDNNDSLKIVSEKLSEYQKNAYDNGKVNPRKGKHNSEEQKQKQSETMKIISAAKTPEEKQAAQNKSDATKIRNHSFKSSKFEDNYYKHLLSTYDADDIIRQYKDERYPFKCDFYIKSEDLFIEVNEFWHHGPHPFDPNNPDDLNILEKWKQLALKHKSYKNAIDVWTRRDVEKIKVAKENKLHFILTYHKYTVKL